MPRIYIFFSLTLQRQKMLVLLLKQTLQGWKADVNAGSYFAYFWHRIKTINIVLQYKPML